MRVTVVICTWNRASLLDQTLAHFHHLHVPAGVEWELLVVNNNCTDDTDEVLRRHQARLPLRRLSEPVQGLCNARNQAITEATGDLILWTDDDVLVDASWLAEYVRAAQHWPEAAFFGGTIEPLFAIMPPLWVSENMHLLQGAFVIHQLGLQTRPFNVGEEPWGANMAFRGDVLRRYRFDPSLGRVGPDMIGYDETRLIEHLRADQHVGVWVGGSRVRHYIPPSRLTRRFVWRYFHGQGRVSVRLYGLSKSANPGDTLGSLVRRYVESRLLSTWLSATFSRQWVEPFLRAARLRGVIDEARHQRAFTARSSCGPTRTNE